MKTSWILEAVRNDAATLEAKAPGALSLEDRCSRVCDALRARFAPAGDSYGVWAFATFDDSVIFKRPALDGGKPGTFEVSFEWNADGSASITGEPIAVTQKWVPLKESAFAETILEDAAGSRLIRTRAVVIGESESTAKTKPGRSWDVLLIQEGMSKNRNRYARKVLAEAAPLYEGAKMFRDHRLPTEIGPMGRSIAECMGFARDVRPVVLALTEGQAGGVLALAARAVVTKRDFREELIDAYEEGNPDHFGLSHDIRGDSVVIQAADGPAYDVTTIKRVESVDWVLRPSAGGRVLRQIVASDVPQPQLEGDARMLERILEQLRTAGVTVPPNCDEATATRLLQEALDARRVVTPPAQTPPTQTAITESERATFEARIAALEAAGQTGAREFAGMMLERALLECSLPEQFKTRIRKRFTAQIADTTKPVPTAAEVTAAIAESVEDVAALREANVIMPHVGTTRIEITKDRREKIQERIADFFDPAKPLQSFAEIYRDLTGDTKITGKITEDVRKRLCESWGVSLQEGMTSATLDNILGDSITRRMLKDYAATELANWRQTVAEVVPLSDFRTVRRLRFGGYGNLPIVGQGAPYASLTSPSDEEATYAPAKRGGTEQITIEMIKNDDVGVIRRIPGKLAKAAAQTLHEFVWDLLANNSAIYDSVALAAVGHNNLTTTALSAATISALRLMIKSQTDMSSGKRLGLTPRYLIVPQELEELAFQLTTSDRVTQSANNDPSFIKKMNLTTIVVEYWTDTTDYWLTASVDQAPMIEIGFLDGQEQPELMVQDNPTVGSMFSNDQLTWKIRHIYGGSVQDYRPFAGARVA